MNLSLPADIEQFLNEQVRSGRYGSAEEALTEAIRLLKEMEAAESRIEVLLREAEESGPATEMTPQDWAIESEALKRLKSNNSTRKLMGRKRDLTEHFVFLAEHASMRNRRATPQLARERV